MVLGAPQWAKGPCLAVLIHTYPLERGVCKKWGVKRHLYDFVKFYLSAKSWIWTTDRNIGPLIETSCHYTQLSALGKHPRVPAFQGVTLCPNIGGAAQYSCLMIVGTMKSASIELSQTTMKYPKQAGALFTKIPVKRSSSSTQVLQMDRAKGKKV